MLSPSNFTRIKTPSQVALKNVVKIVIYLIVYISFNSGIVASKISNKSIEKVLRLKNVIKIQMFSIILAHFFIVVLTHDAVQHLLFLFLFFSPTFWTNWQRFFVAVHYITS